MPTFRQLSNGSKLPDKPAGSSLEKWFERVYDVPFEKFTIEDICRACRQEFDISYILPLAFQKLIEDPLAGELYEGELANAVAMISTSFWKNNPLLLEEAKRLILVSVAVMDDDIATETKAFLYRFGEKVSGFPISKKMNPSSSE